MNDILLSLGLAWANIGDPTLIVTKIAEHQTLEMIGLYHWGEEFTDCEDLADELNELFPTHYAWCTEALATNAD